MNEYILEKKNTKKHVCFIKVIYVLISFFVSVIKNTDQN